MRRQENQPPRPTAGCLPVPLFNQKKRNRVPLTSAPSVNEFFSHSEYMANSSSAPSHTITPGTYGCYQGSGSSFGASQSDQWFQQAVPQSPQSQQFDSNRPSPRPAPKTRAYAPISHPYKGGNTSTTTGQPSYPVRPQDSSYSDTSNKYQSPSSTQRAQNKPSPNPGFSHMSQQSSYRPTSSPQYPQQSRPLPPPVPPPSKPLARAAQPQNNTWKFTNSFGPQGSPSDGKRSSNQPQTARPTQTRQEPPPMKPANENSLRILTAVIDGMRHWSQFKDKAPYLFEIFATLDSAVTLGRHGAKTFLMRDGKKAVQCVFYETEQELPRLIRGQVHRCVGNYDRSRDVLMCVSVRPGLPSELRNAYEAVKASDAEMRALIKSLNEI
ncbi:spermatogenesis-associated protein 22 isoform X1 [Hippoglossus stenolepis]|uniref:spermatogenesis-associated protein 22 isoform X1 n=1 Tax=Hippoglossus stenolepis TaxID=195615 RepID=UPI00159C9C54|nr:spermatogenesis-associated protein 22 isoform X1 [Hippoglossus stenolepis]